MPGDLAGRVALVTGASRGIGAATAERLAELGADVGITARTAAEAEGAPLAGSLERTRQRVESHGVRCAVVAADLADPQDRGRIVPEISAELGPVDILINNAAAAIYAPVAEMPLRRRRLLFELNVHAPVDLIQAVLPSMRARRSGCIVNVTSRTSEGSVDGGAMGTSTTLYGASKAALERVTVGLAAEVRADGVVVNCIAPTSGVWTEGALSLVGDLVAGADFESVEEMADAIVRLVVGGGPDRTGRVLISGELRAEPARGPTSEGG